VDLIIGITAKDISITKRDAFSRIKAPAWKYRDFGSSVWATSAGRAAW
jgi:hypothetical protein